MALKSGVFACLTLALCVSCNVMAQKAPQSEDRGFIIPRSEHLGKETEKSGTPRSAEHLGKETQKTGPVSGP